MLIYTKKELRDLIIAFIVLTICFSIATAGFNTHRILSLLPIIIIGVVMGSVSHELGHKYIATKYSCDAEFKLWPLGLAIAFVTSFFGFVFASPGTIQIHPENRSDEINGRILIAGPMTNMALALVFIAIAALIYPLRFYSNIINLIYLICVVGYSVNSFLATFNLFPLYSLDGTKVLKWSAKIWFIAIAIAGIMMLGSIFIGAEHMIQILMGL
ncbi:site-2 protease family protein [uncultured Methanobrevibacter sp.]|uniref:site-2 protease family protein n=1 Tax=uncultured Methanobrevibacter sp. TaxID=253161 RepID=UPI0025E8FDA1|nr:site-2 protease family protein [uncultured Methanobrevibacter sp.]